MFSFKSFVVLEAGDNPYQFEPDVIDPFESSYHFSDGKTKYVTTIHHFGPRGKSKMDAANVEFGSVHDDGYGDVYHRFDTTGEAGSRASRVLSTIHNIVKQHVIQHPILKTVTFTSEKDEPSRGSLYKRYARKMGGSTRPGLNGSIIHKIPADAYRSSK